MPGSRLCRHGRVSEGGVQGLEACPGEVTEGPLVLRPLSGQPIDRRDCYRMVTRMAKAAGTPRHIRPHSLRHAAITNALAQACRCAVPRSWPGMPTPAPPSTTTAPAATSTATLFTSSPPTSRAGELLSQGASVRRQGPHLQDRPSQSGNDDRTLAEASSVPGRRSSYETEHGSSASGHRSAIGRLEDRQITATLMLDMHVILRNISAPTRPGPTRTSQTQGRQVLHSRVSRAIFFMIHRYVSMTSRWRRNVRSNQ